jgi:hypothetical protein
MLRLCRFSPDRIWLLNKTKKKEYDCLKFLINDDAACLVRGVNQNSLTLQRQEDEILNQHKPRLDWLIFELMHFVLELLTMNLWKWNDD